MPMYKTPRRGKPTLFVTCIDGTQDRQGVSAMEVVEPNLTAETISVVFFKVRAAHSMRMHPSDSLSTVDHVDAAQLK